MGRFRADGANQRPIDSQGNFVASDIGRLRYPTAHPTGGRNCARSQCRTGLPRCRTGLRCLIVLASLAFFPLRAFAAEPGNAPKSGVAGIFAATASQRQEAIDSLPLRRLTPEAGRRVLGIAESPTLYRRLPVQAIDCDQEMFLFLTRNPEVLVGIWQLMGITKVEMERVAPYRFEAIDGSGTECEIDLVYGDANVHVFVATGSYSGRLVAAPVRGRGVFVMRSSYAESDSGGTTVTGVLDCFIQFDQLGADLIARTFSGLIGRAADQNYTETARFISQIAQMSEKNPMAMVDLARRLPQVEPATRRQFAETITEVAERADRRARTAGRPGLKR